ncbi:MAG: response regulator [Bacteroidota bacterium]
MQKRILLIDDEASLRRSLALGLKQFGYDVEPCENGFTALSKLELYKKNDVNLDTVLVDINLPDINGIKLGKIIKSKYPETSMLYITGFAENLDFHDLEELKADGLIEKPFTAEEITEKINQILSVKPKEKLSESTSKKEPLTTSAYVIIKVKEEADFFSLYKKLYFMEGVLYCDATKGDIDIFLLIQSDSAEQCRRIFENEIKPLEGIKSSSYLLVEIPVLNDNIKEIINAAGVTMFEDIPGMSKERDSKKSVYSYVLVDVEREKLEQVYPVLRLTENVLYCDFTNGSYNLILMVYGSQFSEIDKIIEKKIINLDGVLKVKEYPIINIFEM